MIRRTFLVSASSLLLASACRLPATGANVEAEQPAPAFSLPDHRGNVVSLASLIDKGPAVVIFYRGAW